MVATGGPLPAALPGLLGRLTGPGPVGEVWSSDRVPEVLGLDPAEAEAQGCRPVCSSCPSTGTATCWRGGAGSGPRPGSGRPIRRARYGRGRAVSG